MIPVGQGRAPRGNGSAGIPVLLPPCPGYRECLPRQLLLHQLHRAQLSRWLQMAQEASKPRCVHFPGKPQSELSSLQLHSQLLLWVLPWYLVSTKNLLAQ